MSRTRALAVVRAILVVAGLGGAGLVASAVATQPAPPDGDGFLHGGVLLYGSVLVVLALGVAAIGVALPALVGTDDLLGFGRWQRLVLRGALTLVGGGLLAGLAVGVLTELQFGIALWLFCLVVAVCLVFLTVVWRLGQALVATVSRTVAG